MGLPEAPLELPGWLEFNAWRSHVKPERFILSNDGPELRSVFYLDRRGHVTLPENNPYLPVAFRSERQRPAAQTADWHRAARPLVAAMRERGLKNLIVLPPDVTDVRPWAWDGFSVRVRYTYWLPLPFDEAVMERGHRQNRDKAGRRGMTVARVMDVEPVGACLSESQERKRFALGLGCPELVTLGSLIGDDCLRMYVCFDPSGRPAASCVILHAPGASAIAWLAGVRSEPEAAGGGPFLWPFVFADLAAAGAVGIDLCGANIAPVAEFKSRWGAKLMPTYGVRGFGLRTAGSMAAEWLATRSGGRQRPRGGAGATGPPSVSADTPLADRIAD